MLDEIAAPRFIPVRRAALRSVVDAGRGTLEVDYARLRYEPDFPPGLSRTRAEIHFLEVQEIAFVQQADILENAAPNHEARAGDPITKMRGGLRRRRYVIAPERTTEELQSRPRYKLAQWRRRTVRRRLGSALGVFETTARHAGAGMRVHEFYERGNRPMAHDGVRIEQQEVVGRGRGLQGIAECGVVAESETAVALERQQRGLVPPSFLFYGLRELFQGSVAGGVVDQDGM